jgi:hypothetical protein
MGISEVYFRAWTGNTDIPSMTRALDSADSLGPWWLLFENHLSGGQEYRYKHKNQGVGYNDTDGVAVTVSPDQSADLCVSAVTAQDIVAVFCVTVESITTNIKVNYEENDEIDEGQNKNGNEYKLRSP